MISRESEMKFPLQSALPFGWVKDDSDNAACVPIVDFDYDSVFKHLDGDPIKPDSGQKRPALSEILSPHELEVALAVARKILKHSSHEYQTRCATWRNPDIRARRIAGFRRAWKTRDRQLMRDKASKLWRERRCEMIANIKKALRKPGIRKRLSEQARATWANPLKRQQMIAKLRDPQNRQKISANTTRYFKTHPEARQRNAERLRLAWRNPAYRRKMIRLVSENNKRRHHDRRCASVQNPFCPSPSHPNIQSPEIPHGGCPQGPGLYTSQRHRTADVHGGGID